MPHSERVRAPASEPEPFVSLRGLTKRFGSLTALDAVDLDVRAGEVLALLGENGAGKTTLTKLLYGLYQPDEGEVSVAGRRAVFRSPADAIASGIGLVTQHFSLVPSLTVTENVVLGREGGAVLDRPKLEAAVLETARRYDLDAAPRARVRNMSVGAQQRVEILKALHRDCQLLILDEPTAVLTPQDSERLFETLESLRQQGLAVIIITHKLREVMRVSQRVVVLRGGVVAGERVTAEATEAELARLMIGRDAGLVARQVVAAGADSDGAAEVLAVAAPGEPPAPSHERLLEVERLTLHDRRGVRLLREVTFDLRAGELVGVAAVAGNGQSELVSILTGMTAPSSGAARLAGTTISGLPPERLTQLGVGRIPEDRFEAVIGQLTVRENLALEHLDAFTSAGHLASKRIADQADRLIEEYQVKAKPTDLVRTLSGGNIQKIVLARTLSRQPRLVVAAQPTRGLDVGATAYVHQRLLEQRERGAAVLLVSEDLDEVIRLSDRVLVMYGGRLVGDFDADEVDLGRIGLLMAGEGVAHA